MKRPNMLMIFMGEQKENPNGCEVYRGFIPFTYLKKNGYVATADYFETMWHLSMSDSGFWQKIIDTFDVFVFPRMVLPEGEAMSEIVKLFDVLQRAGKKVVYEVDDDYTNEHRKVIDGDAMFIASRCDAITVTTPYLAELMAGRTGKPTYILPNMIDPAAWRKTTINRTNPNRLIVGLTGSSTHDNDWRIMGEVLPRIAECYPHADFILGGYHPDYLADLPRTERQPGLPYHLYAQLIKACDIVLAPVDPEDRFNLSKSPIKVLEGMGARRDIKGKSVGAATIATDTPVYQLAITPKRKNGLLVEHTPEAWFEGLSSLIEDDERRMTYQRNGYNWVWQRHDIGKHWRQWAKAYADIAQLDKRKAR